MTFWDKVFKKRARGNMLRDYILLVVLAIIMIAVCPRVINEYYLSILVFMGIYLIAVVGLNLVMGYAGQISLGHAGFFGMGAMISMILTNSEKNGPLEQWLGSFSWMPEFMVNAGSGLHHFMQGHMVFAILTGAVITGLLAILVGIPTLKLKGHYLAMATLGLGIIIYKVFNEEVELTGGPSGLGVPYLKVFGHEIDPNAVEYYYLVWGVAIFFIALSINLVHSRIGRALRSIHSNEMAAAASGVPVMKMKVMVFALSAVYASVAGSLYAHYATHVNPSPFNFLFSVKLVVMVVVGGMGSIWGSVLGTGLMTALPNLLVVFEEYDMVLYGSVLILVVAFFPNGLIGLFESFGQAFKKLLNKKKEETSDA